MTGLVHRFRQNTGWLFLGKAGSLLINFVAILLVARHLGPELLGRLSYALAAVALLAPFAQLGLNSIVTRDLVNQPQARAEILGTSLALRLFAAVLTIGVGLAAIHGLRPDDSALHLYLLLLLTGEVFKAFLVIGHWMESEAQGRLIAICELCVSLAMAVSRVGLVLAGAPLIAFVVAEALHGLLIAITFVLAFRRRGHSLATLRFSLSRARDFLRQCAPLIASGLTAVIYLKIDQVMLGEMIGDAEVGIYAVAARISEVWYFVPTIIATSAFPFLLRDRAADVAMYRKRMQQLMDVLLWMGIGVAIVISLVAPVLVPLLFGEAYSESAAILLVHVWGGVFISVRALASKWILAEGILIFSLVSQGAGGVTNVLLNLALIPTWGALGAAIATVCSYSVAAYFSFILFPETRPIAGIMTMALAAPLRLARTLRGP